MNDLFQPTNDDHVELDPNKSYYELLVGPEAKFKDQEALAKGKYLADQMIAAKNRQYDQLSEDFVRVNEQLKATAKLQDLIDQLNSKTTTPVTTPSVTPESTPAIDENKIRSLFQEEIKQSKRLEVEENNYNLVQSKFKEKFGTEWQRVLLERSEALGLPKETVNQLARQHPTVLFKTLGVDEAPITGNFQPPPRSIRQSDPFAPNVQERTWSWYQDQYKKKPSLYHDQKMNQQMVEDYKRLGAKFEDGDFHRFN